MRRFPSGLIGAALLGSEERMEYSVVGDAVNLAQRIQQFAAAGEIALGESAYRSLSHSVEAEDLGEVPVKGRASLVRIFKVDPSLRK